MVKDEGLERVRTQQLLRGRRVAILAQASNVKDGDQHRTSAALAAAVRLEVDEDGIGEIERRR